MSTIVAENLTKVYDNKVVAVDSIDLDVNPGEVFGFLGPNGAGKSTTIKMIAGIAKPTSGKLTVLGSEMPNRRREVQNRIGYVPQDLVFYDHLTVDENLDLFATAFDIKNYQQTIDEAKDLLSLEEFDDRVAENLSGGQKRRLNVAIGLLNQPELLILDEPSAGMDPQSRNVLWESVKQMAKENLSIILTTHLIETADILSDRICIIDHGKIQTLGTPKELKSKIGNGDIIEINLEDSVDENQIEMTVMALQEKISASIKSFPNQIIITTLDGVNVLGTILPEVNSQVGKDNIINISMRDNTLEDVFIELTGRRLRE